MPKGVLAQSVFDLSPLHVILDGVQCLLPFVPPPFVSPLARRYIEVVDVIFAGQDRVRAGRVLREGERGGGALGWWRCTAI